jgi:hypothetical protein
MVSKLDEDRSYWSVTGQIDEKGQEHPVARSVTYAEARKARRGLTFTQFASQMHMRHELPNLL